MTGKREREREAQRRVESTVIILKRKEREIKKNESEKEIGSNGEMETREEGERKRAVLQMERDMC